MLTREQLAEIHRLHASGCDKTEIASQTGHARSTVIAALKNTPAPAATPQEQAKQDVATVRLRHQLQDADSRYKALLAEHAELQRLHAAALGVRDDWQPVPAIAPSRKSTARESTALIVASDWHCEEQVRPETVSSLNEFSPAIARKRAAKHWQSSLRLVEMCRSSVRIDTCVVGLLGDFISGYIHDELVEVNAMSPTQAIVFAGEMIEGGLRLMLDEGKFTRLVAVCCVGNHGRTTQKRRVATGIQNSYEWLLFYMLRRSLPEVEWQLPTGYHNWLTVYGTRIRFHHGESVRFQGGVGGLTIPLNKAVAQWNKARPADMDVLGHWHQRISTREAIVNGSLIGYSPFAVEIKAPYEPPQQSFALIHPHRGRTVEAPIFVEATAA